MWMPRIKSGLDHEPSPGVANEGSWSKPKTDTPTLLVFFAKDGYYLIDSGNGKGLSIRG
jgi:hypothetical protein